MGGYYGSRTAAFEPRLKAVGVVGGPYDFARMPELVRAKFMHASQILSADVAREYAARFTLDGLMDRIKQPYLVMHGQHDAVMPWQEAEQRSKMAPRGEFLLFPDGNTACHSVNHQLRPYLADWIKEKLEA
jgi:dipeptidyl aminopeptidase/acylaminoacyl peptidase